MDIDETALLARQPIYRADLSVLGYELLFRNAQPTSSNESDENIARTSVLLTAFVDVGLHSLVGDTLAFVSLPRDFLVGVQPIPAPPETLVIEIMEDVSIDDQLVAGLTQLSEAGYTIALDHVVYSEMLLPIMDLVDIIKIPYAEIPQGQLQPLIDRFREWPVELLAENLESNEQFEECRDAGFDLFQGFFLSRPEGISGNVSNRQAGLLRLLTQLQSSCQTFEELKKLVIQDADLSFRMMRYLDSSSVGLRKEIASLHHGLVLLGKTGVRRLITLLALESVEGTPSERLVSSLIRATMCETLSKSISPGLTEAAYTTGLFSQLDCILNQPMRKVMQSLPLKAEIRNAILNREGVLGQILQNTIAYESAAWDEIDQTMCSTAQMKHAYLDAVITSRRMMQEIAAVTV